MKNFTFDWLIAPITKSNFVSEYWEKNPLVVSRDIPSYYETLLSVENIDHIITATDLRFPGFRLARFGSPLSLEEYVLGIPNGNHLIDGVADIDRILGEYQKGATIILQAIHRYWPPLSTLCKNLESILNHRLQTNIYMTPHNSQGFSPHWDTHDVFVLQVSGSKHWLIYDSPIQLPHNRQRSSSETAKRSNPLCEFDLYPGDLAYIPRGFIHEAYASDTASLHITLGVLSYTWANFFSEALSMLIDTEPDFRRSLPIGFLNDPHSHLLVEEKFQQLLKQFQDKTKPRKVIEKIAESFVSSRLPALQGHLVELDLVDKLSLDTMVNRRDGVIYRVQYDENLICLLFHGKKLTFPPYVKPALDFIANTEEKFTIKNLPNCLTNEGKLVLVKRLVREGFLTLL